VQAEEKYFYLNSMKETPVQENGYSEEKAQRIAWLIAGYLQQTLGEKEHDELDEWVTASDANQQLFEELIHPAVIEKGLAQLGEADTQAAIQRIKAKLHFTPARTKTTKRRFMYYGIAASLVLLAGIYLMYTLINPKSDPGKIATENDSLQPGGNYAMLRLPNGKTINLYEAKKGLIDSSEGIEVLKTADGQLSYVNSALEKTDQHMLITPVGGQYNVLLPDGSRVWLNALSSLKYPVAFAKGKERVVELNGEAYFEIASIPLSPGEPGKTPFVVKVRGVNVEVTGTHFNINAYEDEPDIKTTLLEGKVKVQDTELLPGEQAQVSAGGKVSVHRDINTEEVIAWKNGLFVFKGSQIGTIMRQVNRWYDAEIVYEARPDFHFNATIHRHEPVSTLLQVLEETNQVHFSIQGKKIIVKP
jgi:ferric-dicitrate binding protein FerR (iron transport regulator)